MDRLWAGSAGGKPVAYTIKANELFLGPSPGAVYTMEMDYYRKFDSLSTITTTNDMLTDNPDVYLYGALLEAEPFIKNDSRIQVWELPSIKPLQIFRIRTQKTGTLGQRCVLEIPLDTINGRCTNSME